MRPLEEIESSYAKVRRECIDTMLPHVLAEKRLHFSYIIAELSDWVAELEKEVSYAKNEKERLFLQHKARGLSIAEAQSRAAVDTYEIKWKAELNFTKVKRMIEAGGEMLNAISSKLKWDEKSFDIQG